jgi:hypothetical protein
MNQTAPGCTRTSRVGEASHAAMALGMAAMAAVPATGAVAGAAPRVFEAYFAALAAFVGGAWLVRAARRAVSRLRGTAVPCRPAHALEPHHVAVGLAMVVMAAQMAPGRAASISGAPVSGASTSSAAMASMPGMTGASSGGLGAALTALALVYVWTAVVVLGVGLAKSAAPRGSPSPGGLALLGAPVTVYACELTMTVVMGLMLLG